jgi:23S rRNA pseudouridine1911/1915/1917 synthase
VTRPGEVEGEHGALGVNRFEVPRELAGQRLDRFLADRIPDRSRSAIARLVDDGRVTVGGVVATKSGLALKGGELVVVDLPEANRQVGLVGEDIPLTIAYRDAHLAVIDKPSGLVVHPAPGHARGTLVNALVHWANEEDVALDIDDELRPGLAHRIDKDTSGLIVVAFNDLALRGLQAQFSEHTIERVYRAVILGKNLADTGRIETFYGRHPKDRKKYTGRLAFSPRRAITNYRVLTRGVALALVECRLETGRTHQIRVHLSELGYPIVADPIYGHAAPKSGVGGDTARINAELRAARVMPRLALHAAVLGFVHPVTGERLRFESRDPEDFAGLVTVLSG